MKTLNQRGIQTLASQHGWHENPTNWQYPIFDLDASVIGYRFKAKDSNATPKYWWHQGKPAHRLADWYILPGTIDAIKAANGTVFVVNGEISTLTQHTALVYNTIATTLSEVSVPDLTILLELSVNSVVYLADHDDAGMKAAVNWRDAIAKTGIDFVAMDWGADKKKGYDSNDAWIDCNFDAKQFQALLGSLKPLELPEPVIREIRNTADYDLSDTRDLVRAIENVLSLEGVFTGKLYQQQWKQMRCVHHDDTHASAGFNIDSGVINCQACGSHSPYETADLLGIDKSEFIKKAAPKPRSNTAVRASTKPERPEPIVLPDAPKETRSYAQVLDDEIMALDMAYENGERLCWSPNGEILFSWVAAMLNLASARSSLPAVWVKMETAFINGSLKPIFTIADVVKATGYSTRLITKSLETLEKMTFIHFLRTVSLDTLPSQESEQKGRPSQLWAINHDSEDIRCCLKNMLEKKSATRVVNRALANPKHIYGLQADLNLSDEDYAAYKQRASIAQSEPMNADADQAYMREMFGNGNEWRGWNKALHSDYAIQLDTNAFDNCKELRAQVALWWIDHGREINSREDWQRILGCSDPTIDGVFELAHIKTIPQTEKLELDAPNTVKAMETLYKKTQREYRGKIWKISYKIQGQKGWVESSESGYKSAFVSNLGKVEKVFMILTTPSKQVLMDAAEIAALEAETETTPDNILEPDFTPEPATISKMETVESEPKPKRVAVVQNEHVYTTFPYAWIFRQVQLMVHGFTEYTMLNDGTILDAKNQLVRRRSDLGDTVRWFNTIASDSQQRTTASYYGEDYSEADELKELQKIEAIYFFEKQYSERIAPMRVEQALLIAIVAYVKAGAFNQQVTLSVVEPQTENTVNPYAIDRPDYAKPSAKAIEQMITRFNETDTQKNRFARGA